MADDKKEKSNPTPPPPTGNPRPLPDAARKKARRIYALVVGIDGYTGDIPRLSGCLKDVELVTSYLKDEFGVPGTATEKKAIKAHKKGGTPLEVEINGRLHLCTLKDNEATYWNIIQAFEKHLSRANELDTIWFHFSGHGSEQFAAEEFKTVDPNEKDQTLVCYKEADDDKNQLFLADKELAVLLNKVAKKNPHIIVSLDSCHSGSGTRDGVDASGFKARTYKFLTAADREDPSLLPGSIRSLNTYYGGYSTMEELVIPIAKHVLFSSCESGETAGDTLEGGVFTSSLIENLVTSSLPMNYSRLFAETRTKANQKRSSQNPQFETLAGFNPYTRFLEGTPMPDTVRQYEVKKEGDDWYIHCGAINGLPIGKEEFVKILIDTEEVDDEGNNITIEAYIDQVGAQHSHIVPEEVGSLDASKNYFASVVSMPATPIFVKLEGVQEDLNALRDRWDDTKNILIASEDQSSSVSIVIEATPLKSFILREATGRKFVEVPQVIGVVDGQLDLVLENIEKIARWKRMIELDNPNTRIRDFFDFSVLLYDKNFVAHPFSDKEVEFIGSADNLLENRNLLRMGINFQVTLTSEQQQLFFYAFDIRQNCLIRFNSDEEKTITEENLEVGKAFNLRNAPYSWKLLPEEEEDVRWFKLIVATEEVDYQQLEQSGMIGSRVGDDEEDEIFAPSKISNDWCAETIRVKFVRDRS